MQVSALWRYPVKSMRGHALQRSNVEARGLQGDRRYLVVDANGRFLTQRELPGLATLSVEVLAEGIRIDALHVATPLEGAPREVTVWRSTVQARSAGEAAARFLSERFDRALELVYLPEQSRRAINPKFSRTTDHVSFADGYPILVCTEASLADLEARIGAPVGMERLRPSVVISGCEAWAEDGWRRIRVGALELRIVKGCARCSMTTLDPRSGARLGQEPLKTLATFRRFDDEVWFGQNAIPEAPGEIQVGAPIEVLEAGPPRPAT